MTRAPVAVVVILAMGCATTRAPQPLFSADPPPLTAPTPPDLGEAPASDCPEAMPYSPAKAPDCTGVVLGTQQALELDWLGTEADYWRERATEGRRGRMGDRAFAEGRYQLSEQEREALLQENRWLRAQPIVALLLGVLLGGAVAVGAARATE